MLSLNPNVISTIQYLESSERSPFRYGGRVRVRNDLNFELFLKNQVANAIMTAMGYIEDYQKSHKHPVNRALHTFGIPCVVISIILLLWDFFFCDLRFWPWFVGMFVFGWILQFIGHYFEGKPPAFFSNPIHLLVGPIWWVLKFFGIKPKD